MSFHLLVTLALLAGCTGSKPAPVRGSDSSAPGDDGEEGGAEGGGGRDADADGYPEEEDCDDADPAVNPGAEEICNGRDDNCSGDEADAVDPSSWHVDADMDGWGTEELVLACERPEQGAVRGGDCNDADPAVHPDAEEHCDGVDSNCSGDESDAVDPPTWYPDADGDGYGGEGGTALCDAPPDHVSEGGDCDEGSAAVHPGAEETCDGVDNNCSGDETDASDASAWYRDADGDGHGDPDSWALSCDALAGSATLGDDCDDSAADVHPEAEETCDGVDSNCSGDESDAVDPTAWYTDSDGDGYGGGAATWSCDSPLGTISTGGDCNDSASGVHPGAAETCNGVDNNCSGDESDASDAGSWYRDSDGDGYGDAASLNRACTMPAGYVGESTDCDDSSSAVHPGATETCNGVDNNCSGDESDATDRSTWYRDRDGDGHGTPTPTRRSCTLPTGYAADSEDCNDYDATVYPGATETCDGTDNNCSGDESDATDESTWYRDADEDGYGSATVTTTACTVPTGYVDNGEDCDDSDADVLDTLYWYIDNDGDGWAGDPIESCTDPGGSWAYLTGDCDDSAVHTHPGAWDALGDGIDNNCDGTLDAGDPITSTTSDLALGDDTSALISWTTPLQFCGASYTQAWVGANGRLMFIANDSDYTESAAEFRADGVVIAPLWDDLNPASVYSRGVYAVQYSDALAIHWRVVEYGGTTAQFISLYLLEDGIIIFEYDGLTSTDGLIGWSCGTSSTVSESRLSALVPYDGAYGVGKGTEAAVFEVFTGGATDPNGMEDKVFWMCGTAGDDVDGDGWTDLCGDWDDTDATLHP